MKGMAAAWLGMAVLVLAVVLPVAGNSAPELINYQGRLTDSAGQPLNNVSVDIVFSFYSADSGGTLYLGVEQDGVQVQSGIFNVLIGSGTIMPGTEYNLADVFQKHGEVWMGVRINSDPEMTPRSRVSSAPYALSVSPGFIDTFMNTPDFDGDGHIKISLGGDDCNDGDASRYPGAPEIYGDGIDQDCDGRDPDRFYINPYLQLGPQSSAPALTDRLTVAWETGTAKTGSIRYGITFPPSTTLNDPVSSTRHELDVTGLSPNTLYYYQVTAGSSIGPVGSFRTAPTDLHAPFHFAYIGDTRTNHAAHQVIINMINSWHPAFLLHGGDLVSSGNYKPDWVTFFQIEAPLITSAVLAPVNGNHDIGLYDTETSLPTNLDANGWYYSWDYGNVHFVHTSTEYPGGTQDTQLFNDLAAAAATYPSPRFIIVIMHRNAYSNGGHFGDENYPYSTTWGPEFEQYNVALVLQAHCHNYERFEPIASRTGQGDPPGNPDVIRDAVTYTVSGGGGAPQYAVPDPPGYGGGGTPALNTLVALMTYEANYLEVSGGQLHVVVRQASDQSVIDEYYIIRNLGPTADAGSDFSGNVDQLQNLNATGSSDPESDPLAYTWIQTGGATVVLDNANTATPSFTPTVADTYYFLVVVDDGIDTDMDTVRVTIN